MWEASGFPTTDVGSQWFPYENDLQMVVFSSFGQFAGG
jgi:hypothetical protein